MPVYCLSYVGLGTSVAGRQAALTCRRRCHLRIANQGLVQPTEEPEDGDKGGGSKPEATIALAGFPVCIRQRI